MSKQWGNGYYKGIEAAQSTQATLTGLWFHSRHDDDIVWQGQIVRDLGNGKYLVQLFEWIMGEPSVQKIVLASDMTAWDFYGTNDEMNEASERDLDMKSKRDRYERMKLENVSNK